MFSGEFLDAYTAGGDAWLDYLDPQFDDWPASPSATRIAELRSMSYPEYLQTPEWKRRAKAAKKAAGYRCQVCNKPGPLHAHHRTYEQRGNERPGDLIALCQDCHKLFHAPKG